MKVVLFQPQIPQNTGNIARLCVASQTPLCLIKPLGFRLHSKEMKRAGLDYWEHLDLQVYPNFQAMQAEHRANKCWFVSKKAQQIYTKVEYGTDDLLVFGAETTGLPDEMLEDNALNAVKIPMWGETRSLNLSNSVGIVLYEAYRQQGSFF